MVSKFFLCLLAALIVLFQLGLSTGSEVGDQILPLVKAHRGQVGLALKNLTTGEVVEYAADRPMPTASLIKVAVMVEAYRQAETQRIDLTKMLTLKEEDKVPGSGILTKHFGAGAQLSLNDAIRLMIAYSDNTATNFVLQQVGLQSVCDSMSGWQLPNTKVHAQVYRRETSIYPERSSQFGLGSTTAGETIRLLEMIHKRILVSPSACDKMLEHLASCEDKSMLARELPPNAKFAHKTGAVTAVRCDAGILDTPAGPVAVCVLTNENEDRRWSPENAAERLCAAIGRRIWEHYSKAGSPEKANAPQSLLVGASGRLVEDLQRTLNAKLPAAEKLAVDGDFGPATRQAVVAWQKKAGLNPNGIVDQSTWASLGPLLTAAEPVPSPEQVNTEKLPTTAPDSLHAPPFVTCKAWAIVDSKTGVTLWGDNAAQQLDFASTTKMMTAYIVLRQAELDPSILNEVIVFSGNADRTGGSTADIREGERISVRELLYGLLLPSGNDAATALAEHFGQRFPPGEGGPEELSSARRFVAEMNRTAESLGMHRTTYKNPHGLTAPGHQSTASDLAKLARSALAIPAFRQYVETRKHGVTVVGQDGYLRNVVWTNTNRLLGIDGYLGVKTGTTDAAGACLVSAGRRGDDELIVVVLGSATSDARYVDTRNLFRWAWANRQRP